MTTERMSRSLENGPAAEASDPDGDCARSQTVAAFVDPRQAYGPGTLLADRYRVEQLLGEGAMGIVFAATHTELDEPVAIKFIRPEVRHWPGVVARFAREAKAAVRLKSEHVVNVLDVGTTAAAGPYIVMEYLDGRDLRDVLDQQQALPLARAIDYALQLCDALAVAHSQGVVHRDVKPENLFLTLRGGLEVIKVVDFGVSLASLTGYVFGNDVSTKLHYPGLTGTPSYMAPEQIETPQQIDFRVDIWAVGTVLYELLSGRVAFGGDSVEQICDLIRSGTPAMDGELERVPSGVRAVIQRCLQRQPQDRYQSVAEVAQALAPYSPERGQFYASRTASVQGLHLHRHDAPRQPEYELPHAATLEVPVFVSEVRRHATLNVEPDPDSQSPTVCEPRRVSVLEPAGHSAKPGARRLIGLAALFSLSLLSALVYFATKTPREFDPGPRASQDIVASGSPSRGVPRDAVEPSLGPRQAAPRTAPLTGVQPQTAAPATAVGSLPQVGLATAARTNARVHEPTTNFTLTPNPVGALPRPLPPPTAVASESAATPQVGVSKPKPKDRLRLVDEQLRLLE